MQALARARQNRLRRECQVPQTRLLLLLLLLLLLRCQKPSHPNPASLVTEKKIQKTIYKICSRKGPQSSLPVPPCL
jgi:hypothetical protein